MTNQLLIKGTGEKPKLTIEQLIERYALNPDLSDVCFLVGSECEKICAHRFLLAAQSEVFKSMFFGDLKESKYEIAVPDLTPVGFRNMLKYFYTKKVEIDLSEMHATYMAANKYLAFDLIEDLTDQLIKSSLDIESVCMVYDQLLKLEISDSLISDVRIRIATRFPEVCETDGFKQIDEDTLVAILNFNMLNITELELLKACMSWTDGEVARQHSTKDATSKRMTFWPIKHLIRFGDLSLQEFCSIFEIDEYMSLEEIGSIFLHLSHPSKPIQIDYQSLTRGPYAARVARAIKDGRIFGNETGHELKFWISVNKRIFLTSIATFGASNCNGLEFEIQRDEQSPIGSCTVAGQPRERSKGWLIDLADLALILEPGTIYKLRFSFSISSSSPSNHLHPLDSSWNLTLKSDDGGTVFKIESDLNYHCIETIVFTGPFE